MKTGRYFLNILGVGPTLMHRRDYVQVIHRAAVDAFKPTLFTGANDLSRS